MDNAASVSWARMKCASIWFKSPSTPSTSSRWGLEPDAGALHPCPAHARCIVHAGLYHFHGINGRSLCAGARYGGRNDGVHSSLRIASRGSSDHRRCPAAELSALVDSAHFPGRLADGAGLCNLPSHYGPQHGTASPGGNFWRSGRWRDRRCPRNLSFYSYNGEAAHRLAALAAVRGKGAPRPAEQLTLWTRS